MNVFVYSDESGVFDKAHNDYFVFGGLIFFDKETRDDCSRMYIKAENDIRKSGLYGQGVELKAAILESTHKRKLFRALNNFTKFAVVVHQKAVLDSIFDNKKTKQRYLDFVYKMAIKHALKKEYASGYINLAHVCRFYIMVDEHTTATNGRYELCEGIEQELRYGTHNFNYSHFNHRYAPIQSMLK